MPIPPYGNPQQEGMETLHRENIALDQEGDMISFFPPAADDSRAQQGTQS
jgi:hypothetical protein